MRLPLIFLTLICIGAGCASSKSAPGAADIVFIVPGVEGNSAGYNGLIDAVWNTHRNVQIVKWGAPPPLMALNFSSQSIHDGAEKKLADTIIAWKSDHPSAQIDLIGHSAGCGVVLGALALLQDVHAKDVVLLAPSVSPGYDLNPALAHIDGKLHVFYSQRDSTFLDWRTSHFGTYDRINSKAAGNASFTGSYPADKLIQHAYDPKWESLGYDGGHFSIIHADFAKAVVAPFLDSAATTQP